MSLWCKGALMWNLCFLVSTLAGRPRERRNSYVFLPHNWKGKWESISNSRFEANLAGKFRFHIFNSSNFKEPWQGNLISIFSTVRIWRKNNRTKSFTRIHNLMQISGCGNTGLSGVNKASGVVKKPPVPDVNIGGIARAF